MPNEMPKYTPAERHFDDPDLSYLSGSETIETTYKTIFAFAELEKVSKSPNPRDRRSRTSSISIAHISSIYCPCCQKAQSLAGRDVHIKVMNTSKSIEPEIEYFKQGCSVPLRDPSAKIFEDIQCPECGNAGSFAIITQKTKDGNKFVTPEMIKSIDTYESKDPVTGQILSSASEIRTKKVIIDPTTNETIESQGSYRLFNNFKTKKIEMAMIPPNHTGAAIVRENLSAFGPSDAAKARIAAENKSGSNHRVHATGARAEETIPNDTPFAMRDFGEILIGGQYPTYEIYADDNNNEKNTASICMIYKKGIDCDGMTGEPYRPAFGAPSEMTYVMSKSHKTWTDLAFHQMINAFADNIKDIEIDNGLPNGNDGKIDPVYVDYIRNLSTSSQQTAYMTDMFVRYPTAFMYVCEKTNNDLKKLYSCYKLKQSKIKELESKGIEIDESEKTWNMLPIDDNKEKYPQYQYGWQQISPDVKLRLFQENMDIIIHQMDACSPEILKTIRNAETLKDLHATLAYSVYGDSASTDKRFEKAAYAKQPVNIKTVNKHSGIRFKESVSINDTEQLLKENLIGTANTAYIFNKFGMRNGEQFMQIATALNKSIKNINNDTPIKQMEEDLINKKHVTYGSIYDKAGNHIRKDYSYKDDSGDPELKKAITISDFARPGHTYGNPVTSNSPDCCGTLKPFGNGGKESLRAIKNMMCGGLLSERCKMEKIIDDTADSAEKQKIQKELNKLEHTIEKNQERFLKIFVTGCVIDPSAKKDNQNEQDNLNPDEYKNLNPNMIRDQANDVHRDIMILQNYVNNGGEINTKKSADAIDDTDENKLQDQETDRKIMSYIKRKVRDTDLTSDSIQDMYKIFVTDRPDYIEYMNSHIENVLMQNIAARIEFAYDKIKTREWDNDAAYEKLMAEYKPYVDAMMKAKGKEEYTKDDFAEMIQNIHDESNKLTAVYTKDRFPLFAPERDVLEPKKIYDNATHSTRIIESYFMTVNRMVDAINAKYGSLEYSETEIKNMEGSYPISADDPSHTISFHLMQDNGDFAMTASSLGNCVNNGSYFARTNLPPDNTSREYTMFAMDDMTKEIIICIQLRQSQMMTPDGKSRIEYQIEEMQGKFDRSVDAKYAEACAQWMNDKELNVPVSSRESESNNVHTILKFDDKTAAWEVRENIESKAFYNVGPDGINSEVYDLGTNKKYPKHSPEYEHILSERKTLMEQMFKDGIPEPSKEVMHVATLYNELVAKTNKRGKKSLNNQIEQRASSKNYNGITAPNANINFGDNGLGEN